MNDELSNVLGPKRLKRETNSDQVIAAQRQTLNALLKGEKDV